MDGSRACNIYSHAHRNLGHKLVPFSWEPLWALNCYFVANFPVASLVSTYGESQM
jgi:hypothetical protein